MAAIGTFVDLGGFTVLRSTTAQADTGQTDWCRIPAGYSHATVYLNLHTLGGTTRVLTPSFLVPDPTLMNDVNVINLGEHAAFTGITAVSQFVFDIGPGVTGIASDVTNSATADSYVSLNVVLPMVLGIKILLDRGDADETYGYTLSVALRGRS